MALIDCLSSPVGPVVCLVAVELLDVRWLMAVVKICLERRSWLSC